MFKTIAFTIIFFLQFKTIYCQKTFESKLATIDEMPDDSAALESLTVLQNTKLPVKSQLNINHRLITRANSLQLYTLAMSVGNESILLANKNNFDSLEAVFHKLIGVSNYYMDQKKISIPYFEKALAIADKNNFWELSASCHNNIGAALADVQKYALSEPHLLRSIAIMTEHGKGNSNAVLRTYRVLARVYSQDKKPEKGEALYLSLIEKGRANKDTSFMYDNMIFYSELLADRGEVEKAVKMSGEVLVFRRKRNNFHELENVMEMHAGNLRLTGRYKESAELLQESNYLMRTNFKKDLEKEISEMEVKYKIEQIRQENEIAEVNAKKQKQVYLFSIVGIILLSGSGFYLWSQRKKANHLTELSEIEKLRFKDVIEAEEKERSRIAQELHDGLGQLLSTARLNVALLEDSVTAEDKPNVERSLKIIDDACVEVRSISHNMMPSALIRLGLIPAINELVNNVNSAKGIKIDFTSNVETSLNKSLDITIYRVVQEILNNMIRHAKADHINISIERIDDNLKISMQDNGIGFNPDELKENKGIGWKNIFSRVSMLDGDIKLESELQKGTLVFINLKLSRWDANAKNG